MDGFGDHFLAGAAFAGDEDCRARGCDLGDQIEHGQHLLALADNVREIVALLERALEVNVFFAQPAAFDGHRDLRDQLVIRPRFGDVVLRAALERRAGHINGAVGGDEDDGKVRVAKADFAQHVESVAVRQAHVEQHQIEGLVLQFLQAGLARFRQRYFEALRSQQGLKTLADLQLVVNNEYRSSKHEPLSWQQGTPVGTMCPCLVSSARPPCPHVL